MVLESVVQVPQSTPPQERTGIRSEWPFYMTQRMMFLSSHVVYQKDSPLHGPLEATISAVLEGGLFQAWKRNVSGQTQGVWWFTVGGFRFGC